MSRASLPAQPMKHPSRDAVWIVLHVPLRMQQLVYIQDCLGQQHAVT